MLLTSTIPPAAITIATKDMEFYHEIPFANGCTISGWFKIADSVDYIEFPDLQGTRVLDIGPASGYFSFLFEQMGADVTALEIVDPAQFDRYGENPLTTPRYGRDPYNTSAFQRLRGVLGSKVTYRRGSVYDIGGEVQFDDKFDLVFMGSLLCHIRDPIGALQHAASVCRGQVIATTIPWEDTSSEPQMRMLRPRPGSIDWWAPNDACFRHWFTAAGLKNPVLGESYLLSPGSRTRHGLTTDEHAAPVRLRAGWATI
jgi:tRNA (mo5U34)-methyltransferase